MKNQMLMLGGAVGAAVLVAAATILFHNGGDRANRQARTPELIPFYLGRDDTPTSSPATVASDHDIEFCFPGLLPGNGCMGREAILALGDRPLGEDRPGSGMSMVHPTDFAVPAEVVSSCGTFARLKAAGWGGLTSADMAVESRFDRFCGLRVMARRAHPAGESAFGRHLTVDDLAAVPDADWPVFGDAAPKAPTFPVRADRSSRRRFVGKSDTAEFVVTHVAFADFDRDDVAEALVYLATRPLSGTALFSTFGLIEGEENGKRRLRPVRWGDDTAEMPGGEVARAEGDAAP